MAERTCGIPGCSKAHRAKGLCSTHYNQQRYTAEQRHPLRHVTCLTCGSQHSTTRTDGRFCSLLCRDVWRIEYDVNPSPQANVAPFCPLPADHQARWYGAVCALEQSGCQECGVLFVHRPGPRSYCSKLCAKRANNRRRGARRAGRKRIRRIEIFERDRFICWMCDRPCDPRAQVPEPLAPTIDHLVPQVHGGDDDPTNLATAHFRCNSRRGSSWQLPEPSPEAGNAA